MQLKRVNLNQSIYHYFERSPSEFALYDDDLDMPVAYGSRNLVDALVRSLRASVTVIYYKRDMVDKTSFKKKIVYDGKKDKNSKV